MLSMPRIVRPDLSRVRGTEIGSPARSTTGRSIKRNKELTEVSNHTSGASSRRRPDTPRPLALPARCGKVSDGGAEENLDHHCLCRSLFDLGFDLSRNSSRHSINPAVFDGRRAFLFCGCNHVRDHAIPKRAETGRIDMVDGADYRRLFAFGRKWRCYHIRKMGPDRSGRVARGNGPDLHRAAGLAQRYGVPADVNRLARIDRRFYRSRNFGRARIHEFDRKSSRMGYVDLADRVVTLVDRLALFAQG